MTTKYGMITITGSAKEIAELGLELKTAIGKLALVGFHNHIEWRDGKPIRREIRFAVFDDTRLKETENK